MRKLSDKKEELFSFLPNYTAKDISDIDFTELKRIGVTHVAVDIDGTLVQAGSLQKAVDKYIKHLVDAKKSGHVSKIVVATNRLPFISKSASRWFNLDGLVSGSITVRKPSKKYYQKLLHTLGAKPAKAVMIGDRLFQDIYGANQVGMWTILVDDLGREPWYDRIVMHRWRQKRRLNKLLKNIDQK